MGNRILMMIFYTERTSLQWVFKARVHQKYLFPQELIFLEKDVTSFNPKSNVSHMSSVLKNRKLIFLSIEINVRLNFNLV